MAPPLDPSFYHITEDEAKFLKECTGISDDEELKHHILTVQAEAYAVYPYPSIRRLSFIQLSHILAHTSKLPSNPAYHDMLNLGKTRENAILLDLGCGFGNDSRKAISDGFPLQNVLCTDLRKGFFDIGHKLFKTTSRNFPLAFFEGDIFDTKFTYLQTMTIPALSSLENIGELKERVSVIHASSFFHLFNDEKQQQLAHMLAQLLSPRGPDAGPCIILGCQIGAPTHEKALATTGDYFDRVYSPEEWKELWIGKGGPFKPNDVEVYACARPFTPDEVRGATGATDGEYYWLEWSVLRK